MARMAVIPPASHSMGLLEVLERVLDKGVVIAGDIKIKLCDIELLTIQIRLVICSVDKAREMGLAWWGQPAVAAAPALSCPAPQSALPEAPASSPATLAAMLGNTTSVFGERSSVARTTTGVGSNR